MAIVANPALPGIVDQKLCSPNRTAANLAGVVALTPLYPGEIVLDLATGNRYRGLALIVGWWGAITEGISSVGSS
jgi:1,6-anhydro-N-acetylmuramate kinase